MKKKENGQVYGWGVNKNGELGLGDNRNRNSPQLLESLKNKKIISICGGLNHQLLLTGKIYFLFISNFYYFLYF